MEPGCVHHDGRPAKARCVECGDLLCGDCRTKVGGRNYCRPCVPEHLRKKVKGRRSPTFAALLSAIPGLGQWYAGSFFRGLVFGGTAAGLAASPGAIPDPIPLFLYVFNLFDAFSLAKERNERVCGIPMTESDRRQKAFFGMFAAAISLFTVARLTAWPDLEPALLWPVALCLYGVFLLREHSARASESRRVGREFDVQPA